MLARGIMLTAVCLTVGIFSADLAFAMSGWDPSWLGGGSRGGGYNGGTRKLFEPSTALLVGSGLAGLAGLKWVRGRKNKD